MATGNSFAKTVSLREQLDNSWAAKHLVIKHDDQPPATISPDRLEQLFRPSKCFDHGTCICGNSGPRGADPLHFNSKLVEWLKQICWSKPKDHKKSEERALLETAKLVIKFEKCDSNGDPIVDSDDDRMIAQENGEELTGDDVLTQNVLFFHIGFANYKTWQMCMHQLYFRRKPNNSLGIDLQTASLAYRGDINENLGEFCFQTAVETFKESLDLSNPYQASLHMINDSQEQLDELECSSGYVQILQCPRIPPKLIWTGSEYESQLRKETRQATARAPRRNPLLNTEPRKGRGRGRGRTRTRTSNHNPDLAIEDAATSAFEVASGDEDEADEFAEDISDISDGVTNDANDDDDDDDDNDSDNIDVAEHEPVDADNGDGPHGDALMSLMDELFPDDPSSPSPSEHSPVRGMGSNRGSSSSSSSSDSDSSSDADSSGDGSDSAPEQEVKERALPVSELVLNFQPYGSLRYNANGYMRAVCENPHHGKRCVRRRVCYTNAFRPGQGRPAGMLAAWLIAGCNCETSQDHIRAGIEPLVKRREARQQVMALPGANHFLSNEANGFADTEPNIIP